MIFYNDDYRIFLRKQRDLLREAKEEN